MKMKAVAISILSMSLVSILSLILLSVLTYIFKWQANTAMIGITGTYILAGFLGGLTLKFAELWKGRKKEEGVQVQRENTSVGTKMIEAISAATFFMGILLLLSVITTQEKFELSGRFLTIWMLLLGSACLGRIL